MGAHTLVVGASGDSPVTGKKADAILAAHLASEAALRLVKPGQETYEVTETVSKIGEAFDCKPVEGVLSHQLEQNKIDGEKTIIQNPSEAQRKEHDKFEFALHEVYAVDVLISSGEGQGREKDAKITIYKSEKSLEDAEILKLLKPSANPKAAKKKKKAAEKAVSDETAGDEAAPTLVEQ